MKKILYYFLIANVLGFIGSFLFVNKYTLGGYLFLGISAIYVGITLFTFVKHLVRNW